MARRRRGSGGLSKREAQGIVALITLIFIAVAKAFELIFKAIAWGADHVHQDVNWVRNGFGQHNGNWRTFYQNSLHEKVSKYIAIACLIAGVILVFTRPIAGGLFIMSALVASQVNRNSLTTLHQWAKELIIVLLVVGGVVGNNVYQKKEEAETQKKIAEQKRIDTEKAADDKKQAVLLDSANRLTDLARGAMKKHNYKRAVGLLDQALSLKPNNDQALYQKGMYFKNVNNNAKAIELFTMIDTGSPLYDDALINRGLCLVKSGKKESAVALFKEASTLENSTGDKLYNKYNPLKKRVVGYVTRCCDGTTSGASGRGACSHHGGVCNWNDPIYDTYRKYN